MFHKRYLHFVTLVCKRMFQWDPQRGKKKKNTKLFSIYFLYSDIFIFDNENQSCKNLLSDVLFLLLLLAVQCAPKDNFLF